MTMSRLKSGVSSVTPFGAVGVARVTRTCGELLSPPRSSSALCGNAPMPSGVEEKEKNEAVQISLDAL